MHVYMWMQTISKMATTSASASASGAGLDDESKTKTVPFYKLFAFADSFDKILMITGSISAVGNGLSMPLMTILLAQLIDSFGQNQNNNHHLVSLVSKVHHLIL